MTIAAKMLEAIRSLIVNVINTIIYVMLRVGQIFSREIGIYGKVASRFCKEGDLRPDGSYAPELVYDIYKFVPGRIGLHFIGNCVITPTGAEFYPEFNDADSVSVTFSQNGCITPYTTIVDLGRWHQLSIELAYIAIEAVKVEEEDDDETEN